MNPADLAPVPPARRTQPAFDLFLIFAGANVVATTLVTGASLAGSFPARTALALIAAGAVGGAALVAALAPIGPRLGTPSIVAARAALGRRGASLLALVLYLTNFAWIALNNVIAASACAAAWGGRDTERAWALALGVAATAVVAIGPRAVALANRAAVPIMAAVGVLLLVRVLALRAPVPAQPAASPLGLLRGLDVVIGYQVSWILMFADYSRYTASGRRAAAAVFLGLGLTALWFMPLGLLAARAAGSSDPGAMLSGLGVGATGAVLLALGSLTTNFVNVYLSALAWKSLLPRTSPAASVWSIGLLGTALSLFSRAWLDRYADLMLVLGGLLVPVGGILLARFFVRRAPVDVPGLYQAGGPGDGWANAVPGLAAWAAGAAVYYAAGAAGGTLPSLLGAALAYLALARWTAAPTASSGPRAP
jgi:purine-cytosine permease-like protein